MKKYDRKLTGIIECDEGNLLFYEDNYRFTFMGTDIDSKECNLRQTNNFVYGKTHDNHPIAIVLNHDLSIKTSLSINVNTFVVGKSNTSDYSIDKLDSITFVGGTLNTVFPIRALQENLEINPEDHKIEYDVIDDSIDFSFLYKNEEYKVNIQSGIRSSFGISGTVLKNDEVIMTLELPKKINLVDAYQHITKIKDILSIMTYRRNVGFDEVIIGNSESAYNSSNIYIREEQELTKKKYYFNVKFTDIVENLPCFFETIYNNSDSNPTYDFGFVPENDKEAGWVNSYMVKNLSSALECEYIFLKIKGKPNEQLEELINTVKEVIKTFKKSKKSLDEKTYSRILSSVGYWSLTFADKIQQMVKLFKNNMNMFAGAKLNIDKNAVSRFVKYRNDITHGRTRLMNQDIADTYFALSGLVCCCFFKRIGASDETIRRLINENYLVRND